MAWRKPCDFDDKERSKFVKKWTHRTAWPQGLHPPRKVSEQGKTPESWWIGFRKNVLWRKWPKFCRCEVWASGRVYRKYFTVYVETKGWDLPISSSWLIFEKLVDFCKVRPITSYNEGEITPLIIGVIFHPSYLWLRPFIGTHLVKITGINRLNWKLVALTSMVNIIVQENYNRPAEHTPGNTPSPLWKESLYSLLVKV